MIGLTVLAHPFRLDDGITNDPVLIAYTAKRSKNGKLDDADDRDLITASDMARRTGTPLAPKSRSPRKVK